MVEKQITELRKAIRVKDDFISMVKTEIVPVLKEQHQTFTAQAVNAMCDKALNQKGE